MEDGTSLPGVNIIVKGTTIGTASRFNGEFIIDAPSGTDTLLVSFVGYELQEVPIDGRAEITIPLERSIMSLEEVVVSVPYGTQTVATTTGSVSQISGEALQQIPTTNLTQSLQGTVTGLIGVTQRGQPGQDDSNLLIRGVSTLGDNAPLVVIDGVPGRQGGLARLNPSDIESVSVLKDASAAIYGSRAANGVILVRTKQGVPGKARVSVNVERSYATPATIPEMADSPTYMQMLNEIDVSRRQSRAIYDRADQCDCGQYRRTLGRVQYRLVRYRPETTFRARSAPRLRLPAGETIFVTGFLSKG